MLNGIIYICVPIIVFAMAVMAVQTRADSEENIPICPEDDVIKLFNGKNLDGLYTWLQDTKYEDPRNVFTVDSGVLKVSGDSDHRKTQTLFR